MPGEKENSKIIICIIPGLHEELMIKFPEDKAAKSSFLLRKFLKNRIAFPSKNLEVPNGIKRCFDFIWEEILRYWTHGLRVLV